MTSLLPSILPMHAHCSHCTLGSSQQPARVSIFARVVLQKGVATSVDRNPHSFQLSLTECTDPSGAATGMHEVPSNNSAQATTESSMQSYTTTR